MWQRKYASAVPKNLGVGVNFRPCSAVKAISSLGVRSACPSIFKVPVVLLVCSSVLLVILKESRFDRLYTARPPSFVQLDIFNHVGVFA